MRNWTLTFFAGLLFAMFLQQAFFNISIIKELISSSKIQYAYGQVLNLEKKLAIVTTEAKNLKSSVYFLGDIMLARDVERKLISKGADFPYQYVKFDKNTDFVVGNFESAIPEVHKTTRDNTFKFSVNKTFLPSLAAAGVTHLSLANNHSFDYGLSGYTNALLQIDQSKMTPFGHPSKLATSSVVFLETENITISVIALHTLFLTPSTKDIYSVLDYAESNSGLVVVYIHWGEEYSLTPSVGQRKLANILTAAGADVIIGHHPHVVQSIEKIGDTVVFYSLGNFIFDQYFSDEVQTGLVLKLNPQDESIFELVPVTTLNSRVQPQELEGEERTEFLMKLASYSAPELKEEILNGAIFIPKKLASSTELVIMAE